MRDCGKLIEMDDKFVYQAVFALQYVLSLILHITIDGQVVAIVVWVDVILVV